MNPKKFFYIMIGVFVLSLLGGVGMLYTANKILKQRSADVVNLRLESLVLEEQQTAFKTAKTNVEKYNYLNDIISSALPQDKDQARTVREIFLLAEQSGIKVKSVQFPSSTLGTVTSAAGAAAASGAVTQAKPVEGLKGVYSVETIVTPYADNKVYKVTYNQLIDLLKRIESNRRAMQVANLQLTPLGQNPTDSISFTLTLNILYKAMKDLNLKAILDKFKPLTNFLKKDYVIIFLVIIACIFAFLIWRIGNLAGAEPTQDAVDEKLLTIIRPRIDPDSIKQIEDLQEQNVNIQSYFSDRANPFQE